MEIYLDRSESICDNCKTKLFNHLFEKEYNPKLTELLQPITEAKARSILLRMGVPENVINTVLLAAMRSFPKIHADFIDVANAAMHFEKVVNIIDLLSILNIEAEKRGIKLP